IVLPADSKVALRSQSGKVVPSPPLSPANGPFPAQAYTLKVGERFVYKTGTVTVMAQFVRGNAVMGRGAVMDWIFPAIFTVCFLLHAFFIVGTFLTPDRNTGLIDDLFKNQNRFAQMILKAPEEQKKRKKLDLSGMKGGAKAKDDEGKFAKKEKPKKDKLASKAGAPRVDPNKREKDRKIALNSGLLSVLKGARDAGAVSNVFGPGGLGTGINNAMGGLRGTEMGDAGGAGGLGTRGTGAGGGGSLGIGGLGTHGHGRGTGGYGNIDLGGKGKARTRVVPGRTIIKGSLSKAEIARVIRRNLARFKFCYEKQLTSNPNLGGKISVYFTIAPTGSVARASVRETSMNEATVEGCVLKVMRSLKFPKPKGGGIVVVTYPFVFAAT
ncbi:MAG: AgmX/PglI C-terminal domain-containing protein, partial [Myxococcota bacterium]